ncbi:MAG: SulP family inorganic anion transporter [Microcella sp.]|uniref:SulP family inorganic anion transporter n=1 Tax=Microcella sp. TaxID=1913979 RepID=UPI0024CB7BD0|nr:SulP family inorganic anion transporter [Microcella sp.]UYN82878.1 MAG: SulP family inorganic anion transporter [Microcella sp.]
MTDARRRLRVVGRGVRALLPSRADYSMLRRTWRADTLAGVTVGVVALPLALAFGVSSGVGAEAGLITAIVAGVVAAVFGGSNVQVSGPTGAMVVVLAPIVVQFGVEVVAVVSLMAGVFVIIGGALRLGRTVTYIPWPVIEGFTLGIAIIIAAQQIPAALGVAAQVDPHAVAAAVAALGQLQWPATAWAIGVTLLVVAIMVVLPRVHRLLPASLIAIVVATVLTHLLNAPVSIIGALPASLPAPGLPALGSIDPLVLIGPAAAVAALAAIESLLSARVAASLAPTGGVDADRELVGQGLASIASGLFGGMPATGAIARTAVNVRSGGRSRLSAIVHSLVLLLVVYAASGLVSGIPLAALAGVLIVTATRMVAPATVRAIVRSTRSDAAIFIITAIVTISFDLIVAVLIGIAAAALMALRDLARSSSVTREPLPGPAADGDERIALVRLDGALFFGAAERVLDEIAAIDEVSVVIIRLSQLRSLDATGARVIADIIDALERRGVTAIVKGVQPQHLGLIERVGVTHHLRHPRHLIASLDDAIEHARSHVARERL